MEPRAHPPDVPGLEQLVPKQGRRPGDRYVRIVSPRREFLRAEGHYVATEAAMVPPGYTGRIFAGVRRALFGRPLATEAEGSERLSVATGYAILASDNISSSAYATEEAMRVLALAGVAALSLTMPIALAIVAVLAVVVLSQLQVIKAYPNGGGSYIVTSDNLGRVPGLVAASSLLIDYVLTVALSGAEAVANGVPSMKPPEPRNASITLILMAVTFGSIFLGLTFLAQAIGAVPDLHEQETLNSLVTRSLVGDGFPYYLVQLSTAVILALAANTGFTGFPRLAAVLANDRFMPRHFADRGERLALSFGIIVPAALASIVLVAFSGSVTALIPLYTIGVFLAFTLSQTGLVRRWLRLRPRGWKVTAAINGVGAGVTRVVVVLTTVTTFVDGAMMVLIVMPP